MINEKIKIISCGGTFEKKYDPISGNLIFNKSCINELIKKSRLTKEFYFENIMMIDSLDMTDKHRKLIANNVQKSKEDKILIIHGTDTMIETGITIANFKRQMQTIVITGAMVPQSIKNSDALFNFGFAVGALNFTKPGVWIAMNGSLFEFDKVIKNTKKGVFEVLKD